MTSMTFDLRVGRSMAVCALLLAIGFGMPSPPTMHAQGGNANLPCSPSFTRTMTPLAVEQGDEAEVELNIEYDCPDPTVHPRVNVMLVIGTSVAADFGNLVGLERNLRAGLSTLVNNILFWNGSKGGLVTYDDVARLEVPLGPNRFEIIRTIDRMRLRRGASAAGFDDAIRLAEQELRANEDGGVDILIVLDTGAPGMTTNAFCALTRIDVRLIQLAVAGGRLVPCMQNELVTVPNDGSGIEEVFDSLAERLFRGAMIEGIRVTDAMKTAYIDYLPGSANIGEPTKAASNRYEWDLPVGSNPRASWQLTYRVRFSDVEPQLAPDRLQVSEEAEAIVSYSGNQRFTIDLHRSPICLARPGRLAEDCDDFQTPTPTASITPDRPTAAPSPTTGPSTGTPAATDTPRPASPTAIPDDQHGSVFLPLLLADEAGLRP